MYFKNFVIDEGYNSEIFIRSQEKKPEFLFRMLLWILSTCRFKQEALLILFYIMSITLI